MQITWRYDLRPTWRVHLVYRVRTKPVLSGRASQRLQGALAETGRVREARVALERGTATVRCVVKGVDEIEAGYVALGYVDAALGQVQGLDLGALTYRSVGLHRPPTMGDEPVGTC